MLRSALRPSIVRQLRPQLRFEGTYQPPKPPQAETNRHRQYYRNQGAPVLKAILIAITTQQLLYWSWLKLESYEIKADQDQSVRSLQDEVREVIKQKKAGTG